MKYPYSVDVTNIPDHLSNPQLEWFILFGICVAGKNAAQTQAKLNEFLLRNRYNGLDPFDETPFETIHKLVYHSKLTFELAASKFGQYDRIENAMRAGVLNLDVTHLTLRALEQIPGIGPKTARFIILYSQPNATCVPLDTHILKYLRRIGYADAPTTTPPSGKKYAFLERAFLLEAQRQGKSVRQLDTEVWQSYALEGVADVATVTPDPAIAPLPTSTGPIC